MLKFKPYLNLVNGTKQEYQVTTKIVEDDGVNAVYIKGIAEGKLDADFGAGIDFELAGAESYMADVRHMVRKQYNY